MKKSIHPKYFDNATVTCSCGAVFKTGSTQEKLAVEICSQCHPFYTGKKKVIDTAGRVDRFKRLAERAAEKKLARRRLGEGGEAVKKPARIATQSVAVGAKEVKIIEKKAEAKKKETKKTAKKKK